VRSYFIGKTEAKPFADTEICLPAYNASCDGLPCRRVFAANSISHTCIVLRIRIASSKMQWMIEGAYQAIGLGMDITSAEDKIFQTKKERNLHSAT